MDLRPGRSFIERFLDAGFDVFMVDWGEPDAVDAGNDLELYVDNYLPRALDRALEVAESEEIDLLGYCFGGVLTLLAAAGYPQIPIRNIVSMATPLDWSQMEGGPGATAALPRRRGPARRHRQRACGGRHACGGELAADGGRVQVRDAVGAALGRPAR